MSCCFDVAPFETKGAVTQARGDGVRAAIFGSSTSLPFPAQSCVAGQALPRSGGAPRHAEQAIPPPLCGGPIPAEGGNFAIERRGATR
jgi:hypothetical protein